MNPLPPKRQQMTGQGAILISAFLMSTNGLFIKIIPWHPMVITGLRGAVAALLLLIVRLIIPPKKNVKNPPFPLWAGAISYSSAIVMFITANKLTTAANVILLQYSAPIWAALLAWLFVREKPHWELWGALILVLGGLTFFFRDALGQGAFLGNTLAIVSGIVFGAQSVFMRMMKDGNPRDSMLLTHILCAAAGLPFVFLYPPSITVSSVASILYMGIFQIGLASLLFAYGIKFIPALLAMLTQVVEPILNPVWVLAITGEKPSPAVLPGGAIIITAVLASSFIGMRREDQKRKSETPQ